ncbi:MAG: N-acetylmuramic acid 6-phosphate etherase [Ignavibacteriae bacterium]|nr:N-acetylmuramic acid 6-phosphate etherase [Ignavibacteriota bacterium]
MTLFHEITSLPTEQNNSATSLIDTFSTRKILECINNEDAKIAEAVRIEIPFITQAVDAIVERFHIGGRLFYVGAGTSGRLGIVDASECPPTFGVSPEMVQGIIAGGTPAIFAAKEGAEDSPGKGAEEIIRRGISKNDIVCGIAASGRTPFVLGAIAEAKVRGCYTIFVSTNSRENIIRMGVEADTLICPNVGAEVISGSTRMKSGTAQKLVLNMLTTASMIRMGKTLGNVMVDLQLTNDKLKERAKAILINLTGIDYQEAETILKLAGGNVKTALVMVLADVDEPTAKKRLTEHNGFIRKAINGC